MVAARAEPHMVPPNWRPPYRTYWYDPWPLTNGRKPTTLRFRRVPAPFAHPTTTLHPATSTTRLESPQTHRARVLHARNASVTLTIRHLGMKTRRTSYRTAKSTCTLCVCDFWSEGPKRQPGGQFDFMHAAISFLILQAAEEPGCVQLSARAHCTRTAIISNRAYCRSPGRGGCGASRIRPCVRVKRGQRF